MSYELIGESKAVVEKIELNFSGDAELIKTDYGHAAMNLARGIRAGTDIFDTERQKKHLRDSVLELIEKFGPKIIPFLRDELRAVLTEEEIARYEK